MPEYSFRLYVTGTGSRSERAIHDALQLCEQHLGGRCQLSVVDVREHPELAKQQRILATPTLVRDFPGPARRVVGDLSNFEQVETGLGLAVRTASTRTLHP